MPLPASIMDLGVPPNATPEAMAALRAEKSRQARLIENRERHRLNDLANYIESHPEAMDQAKAFVERFLDSPAHSALRWALREWHGILEQSSPAQIAALLGNESEATRHLRETCPFARPQPSEP
ncbi:MAG TPA: hypothetical protein PLA50_13755 [Bacteroidia bacterium]|nr:hypothetical protein [Bacteroidia bacterium]